MKQRPAIEQNVQMGLAGRFKLTVRNAESGEITRETDWFNNLILDQGLDVIGNYGPLVECHVGTSSTAPVETQTALVAKVAGTASVIAQQNGVASASPYFRYLRRTWRFPEGAAAGNLSEVGVGWDATHLFSRALILDAEGDPTTITVLSNEFLDVTYELRFYPPETDAVSTVVIGGVTYTVTRRAALVTTVIDYLASIYFGSLGSGSFGVNSLRYVGVRQEEAYSGAIGSITGQPAGALGYSTSSAKVAYVGGSHTTQTDIFFDLDVANFDITSLLYPTSVGYFQFGFSPALPKTSVKRLSLRAAVSWARKTL